MNKKIKVEHLNYHHSHQFITIVIANLNKGLNLSNCKGLLIIWLQLIAYLLFHLRVIDFTKSFHTKTFKTVSLWPF